MFSQFKKSLPTKDDKKNKKPFKNKTMEALKNANINISKERDCLRSLLDESQNKSSYLSGINKDLEKENKRLHEYIRSLNCIK